MKRNRIESPPPAMDYATQKKRQKTIQDQVVPKIFPYLTLCDIEAFSEATGVEYRSEFGVNIEECCVQKHPINYNQEVYKEYGARTTILTLIDLTEAEARTILKYCPALQELTMCCMKILDREGGFPISLSRLTMVDCQVEDYLHHSWFRYLKDNLTHLHLDNLVHSYNGYNSDKIRIFLGKCESLTAITLRGFSWSLNFNGPKVKYLHLTANESIKGNMKCANLTHLHFDVPSTPAQFSKLFGSAKSLERLTTRIWIDPKILSDFTLLNYLEVLSAVPNWKRAEVAELDIPEVKVHFEPTTDYPDLIFEMLNEYCLLEIISYLPARDWIPFATLHPRVECAANSYKYPRAKLTVDDFPLKMFKTIAPLLRNFGISSNKHMGKLTKLSELKSLKLSSIDLSEKWIRVLPVRLERLTMDYCPPVDNTNLSPYFQKLNSSLRVLEFKMWSLSEPVFDQDFLLEVRNLREIKINRIESVGYLAKVLENNMETLERVEISSFYSLGGHCGSVLKLISQMPKLKILGIEDFENENGVEEMRYMFNIIGPKLKTLWVDPSYKVVITDVLEPGNFNQLEDFYIRSIAPEDMERIMTLWKSMKNLRKLRHNIQDSQLMELLVALPQLSEIKVRDYSLTPRKISQFLKQENRTLRIRFEYNDLYRDLP